MITKQELIDFEKRIAVRYDNGELPYLVHFCGGNEDQLLDIFQDIRPGDYVFSTHRNHYHYLLHGGSPDRLEELIMDGRSMFVFDRKLNFYSSSIVCATPSIAAGVAWALKRKGSKKKVWCFLGDGAEDEGHFYEAVRYVDGWDLPCTFIVEDNDRSVAANKAERWGTEFSMRLPSHHIKRYRYQQTYPHGGSGSPGWLKFKHEPKEESLPKKKIFRFPQNFPEPKGATYGQAVKMAMEKLGSDKRVVFVGYNVRHGSAYGMLEGVDEKKRLETPLAENLMGGLCIGMSLTGLRPVLFLERHDFVYNVLDAIVNQMDRVEQISHGEFKIPVIIKAVVGSKKPFYAGITHTSDLTDIFKQLLYFPVVDPQTPGQVLYAYEKALKSRGPILVSERKELY